MAIFCPNCGNAINPNDANCPSCGTNLSEYSQNNQHGQPKKKAMSGCTIAIILFVCFFVFILFAVGIIFTMAYPNFKVARTKAREKACFSNIRVLSGAVEMYNMDNATVMKSLDINTLVKQHYIKEVPEKPEPECEYESKGDLSEENGIIYCKFHGELPRYR